MIYILIIVHTVLFFSGFSFFGGNVNGDSKLGGSCGA